MTLRFAVIGDPVAHSRSPEMHEAAYRALGIDARYERIHVEAATLEAFVGRLAEDGFRGVNATLPHKERLAAMLDEVSATARAIGAVNCVTVDRGRALGDNTDAPGLVRALEEAGFAAAGARVVVLGSGGAARASVVGLSEAGAARVTIAARRIAAAEGLAEELAGHGSAELEGIGLGSELAGAFGGADLVVQATSATLGESEAARRFADALPIDALPEGALVTDLVYAPRMTTVLAAAEARGLRTVDGMGLLLHQGAISFERWLGRPAPVEAMRAALV